MMSLWKWYSLSLWVGQHSVIISSHFCNDIIVYILPFWFHYSPFRRWLWLRVSGIEWLTAINHCAHSWVFMKPKKCAQWLYIIRVSHWIIILLMYTLFYQWMCTWTDYQKRTVYTFDYRLWMYVWSNNILIHWHNLKPRGICII